MGEIYEPAEDSYFFSEFLRDYLSKEKRKDILYLDMGCGSGILSKTAEKFLDKTNILASDINPKAVKLMKKEGFKVIKSNLFKNIKGTFDLITFNAPYLPEDKNEPIDSRLATTGGKEGDEISLRFLKESKKHLNRKGRILLLVSSLTPTNKINKFKPEIVGRKKLFFEELKILQITNK